MKSFVIITIDTVDVVDFERSITKNPHETIVLDLVENTATYKVYCTSLDEAYEIGYEYGKRYKKKSIAQEIKKTRNVNKL